MIFWNGKSSDDVRVIVERYPNRTIPARKIETISVPGRNGDLLIVQDAWENYTQSYDIYISAERDKLPLMAHAAARWLCAPEGYCPLQDDYDRDVYRMAYFAGGMEIENILNRFGRATIEFVCKPQAFLLSGKNSVNLKNGGVLYNPTGFAALPKITVHGSGSGSVRIGERALVINQITDGMVLDSETQNAYAGTANLNGVIEADEFPVLVRGDNVLYLTGGITSVDIVPGWWTL